jgi:hypothetical protein
MLVRSLLALAAASMGGACEGSFGEPQRPSETAGAAPDGPTASGTNPPPTEAVDATMRNENATLFEVALRYFPGTTASGGPKRLVRLTRTQLDATTQALLPAYYKNPVAAAMPRDPLQTNYEYADNLGFNAANFTPFTRWVDELTLRVEQQPAALIDCAAQNNAPACLDQQARTFVTRAFRGITDDALLTRFAGFFVSRVKEYGFAPAAADLVALTLTSPRYVFREEVHTAGATLLPAQLLASISFTLADAPPEALGLDPAVAASQLSNRDLLAATVGKVMASPQAREKLTRFFIAWLEVKEPADFTIASEVFPEFTPALAAAMVDDTRAFLKHQLSAAAPRLKDITQSNSAFVSEALATIYGIPKPTTSAPVALDPEQRLGIFTHPAVIASHSGPTTTRLVKRGVFFTRKVMCLPLGQPPPGTNTTLAEVRGVSERQRVESGTRNAPCAGCHAYINPFGFMQESYDTLGRYRTLDEGQAVDASIMIDFLDEGRLTTRTGVDALRALTNSLRFQQCFARQLFRFYMGRDELAGDDPVLRQMFFGFANRDEQNILSMLQVLAGSASFLQRAETP